MPDIPRKRINDQWCEYHWAPYKQGMGYGLLGSLWVMEALVNLPEFVVLAKYHEEARRLTHGEAANEAMNAVVARYGKPVCCILGDTVMTRILTIAQKPVQGSG